jgi:hypothetical protein
MYNNKKLNKLVIISMMPFVAHYFYPWSQRFPIILINKGPLVVELFWTGKTLPRNGS